jgi:hypothetical protein
MKIDSIIGEEWISEANIADKIIKEPGKAKQLMIAWRHDDTLPPNEIAKLGPKPDEKAVAKEWSSMLEQTLERTNYGDLSRDFKFAEWLTKLFITGAADWEDISGEGGDALGAWHALSQRGLLDTKHQDLNKFKTLRQLQIAVVNNAKYQAELKRIKNAAEIAKMKKDQRDIVIIDDDKYWVSIPLNYGACYVFNNTGHISNFCTGGSGGMRWFSNYAPSGPMVMIVDKANIDNPDGKWQMHANTNQLVNSIQDYRYDQGEYFGQLFPGLMRKIIAAMMLHADQIKEQSKEISNNGTGYNVAADAALIKNKFPKSLTKAKNAPADEPEPEIPGMPGTEGWYRYYLAPNFENLLDQDATSKTHIRVTKAGGQRLRGRADTLEELMTLIYQNREGWLTPDSVIRAEWAPES